MNRIKLLVALMMSGLWLTGCGSNFWNEKTFAERHAIEKQAEGRYVNAMEYMRAGRYELARQEFAVAAATAKTEELKELAENGYQKADAIIKEQR